MSTNRLLSVFVPLLLSDHINPSIFSKRTQQNDLVPPDFGGHRVDTETDHQDIGLILLWK